MSVAWVGAGIATVGLVSSASSASKARKSADKANATSMAFEQQKYDDWQEMYGPIQTNLAEYYNNLTPEYYEAVGLENFAMEQEMAMTRLNENLAQRGIDPSSGIAASLTAQTELDAAEGRATIRRDAPRQAAEDKSRFLQIGLGQNPGSSLSSALSNQASSLQSRANAAEQSAGKAIGSAVTTIGTALADYTSTPATPATPATPQASPAEINSALIGAP
jgi:hypothetical protein